MVMQRKRGKDLLTAAEYARLRGLNRSTISRQIRSGQIPTHEGLIDPTEADRARERNLDPAKSTAAKMRREHEHSVKHRTEDVDRGGGNGAVVAALAAITSPSEVLAFARSCLRIGLTPEQACAVGQLYATRPAMAIPDIDPDDLTELEDVTDGEWKEAFGRLDLAEAERLADLAFTE